MNERFEWNNQQAATNKRVHDVSFDEAVKALADLFMIEWVDDREVYGEERINALGMCDDVILHVTYTERDERIRIISARRAKRHEQINDYRQNSN